MPNWPLYIWGKANYLYNSPAWDLAKVAAGTGALMYSRRFHPESYRQILPYGYRRRAYGRTFRRGYRSGFGGTKRRGMPRKVINFKAGAGKRRETGAVMTHSHVAPAPWMQNPPDSHSVTQWSGVTWCVGQRWTIDSLPLAMEEFFTIFSEYRLVGVTARFEIKQPRQPQAGLYAGTPGESTITQWQPAQTINATDIFYMWDKTGQYAAKTNLVIQDFFDVGARQFRISSHQGNSKHTIFTRGVGVLGEVDATNDTSGHTIKISPWIDTLDKTVQHFGLAFCVADTFNGTGTPHNLSDLKNITIYYTLHVEWRGLKLTQGAHPTVGAQAAKLNKLLPGASMKVSSHMVTNNGAAYNTSVEMPAQTAN